MLTSNQIKRVFKTSKQKTEIENNKVIAYLLKYYSAKKLIFTAADIFQPEAAITKTYLYNINVFLKNP